MSAISIRGVRKAFKGHEALKTIDLEVQDREFCVLLGPSGCGKTTLLRMLAGFEEPTSGRIWLDGQDMTGVPPYERPVNMMFQSYALFPHMSVEKNVGYGLKHEKMSAQEKAARVREMLELVQLLPYATRKPHQISGGQRQRVALARALARQPKLLLLDEPLAALDKKLREHTQFELINIQETLGGLMTSWAMLSLGLDPGAASWWQSGGTWNDSLQASGAISSAATVVPPARRCRATPVRSRHQGPLFPRWAGARQPAPRESSPRQTCSGPTSN